MTGKKHVSAPKQRRRIPPLCFAPSMRRSGMVAEMERRAPYLAKTYRREMKRTNGFTVEPGPAGDIALALYDGREPDVAASVDLWARPHTRQRGENSEKRLKVLGCRQR